MALPISPTLRPGRIARMPRHSASYVSLTSAAARGATASAPPTSHIRELSPCQPAGVMTVTSMLTMSPARSGRASGMPWQTTWLTEMQVAAGKPHMGSPRSPTAWVAAWSAAQTPGVSGKPGPTPRSYRFWPMSPP